MGMEWQQVVSDLVASLSRSSELVKSLFSVLEVLPEECESYPTTSRVDKQVVAAFRGLIKAAAPEMLKTLGNPLLGNAKDPNLVAQILRCFSHWLRACDDAHIATALQGNPLVVTSFDALGNSDLFESALSAVCELVLVSTHKDLRPLLEYCVSRSLGYRATFTTYVITIMIMTALIGLF